MKKMQPIPAGEQATLKTTIEGEIATVIFTVKPNHDPGAPRFNLTQVFNFEDISREELIGLAVRPLRIDVQSVWRSAKDRMDADVWQDRTWNVRAMLDQTRQKADPTTTAERAIKKLTKAERDELFKKYK